MIDLYSGIVYTFPIPIGNVNEIIKKSVAKSSLMLNNHTRIKLHLATEDQSELEITKGDYYFCIYTDGLSEEWSESTLIETGLEIKKLTGTKVGLKQEGPWGVFINGVDVSDSDSNPRQGCLSQEAVNLYLKETE